MRDGNSALNGDREPLSFNEAVDRAGHAGCKKHILLGNGFSRGVHRNFAYSSLYDKAKPHLSGRVKALFLRSGTSDFEKVLRQLNDGQWIAREYGMSPAGLMDMCDDYESLRNHLIVAIEAVHPARRADITDRVLRPTADFLRHFCSVFSTNYDLLLYWAILSASSMAGDVDFQDGFGPAPSGGQDRLVFLAREIPNGRFVHYLHGGLHLTTDGTDVRKLKWEAHNPILSSVRDNLEQDQYPLFVAEGKPSDKLKRIRSSSYLSWCFEQFRKIEGHLFTYGSALTDQDKHLWDAVAQNSKVKTLCVGIYGDVDTDENQQLVARAQSLSTVRRLGQPLNLSFYNSESASVWGHA